MRAVVTGGAGFIGSHLVDRLLNKGYEVVIIDNFCTGSISNIIDASKQISIIHHDIRDPIPANAFKNSTVVFHLAALADIVPSIENPQDYMSTNVQGTVNVLEAARKSNIKRFIYTASSSCYGVASNFPTTEDDEITPTYPYALSKYLGELVFFHWLNLYGLKGLSLRLFNVYGPRARTTGNYGAVMGVFLAQKIAQKPFTVVGDGNQVRDFTYVSDVAEAFLLAGESEITGEAINIGTQNPQSINRLVQLLDGDIEFIPKRPGEPDRTHADILKAKNLLAWKPKITFEEGVKEVLNQINLWKDAPLWEKKDIEKATSTWFQYLGKNETY
jgi:UDP-glucose 4-epimerase